MARLRSILAPLLLHPWATAITVISGIVTMLGAIAYQAQQIGFQLGPLMYMNPKSGKLAMYCMITAAVCNLLAGTGRSFISWVDKDKKPPDANTQGNG